MLGYSYVIMRRFNKQQLVHKFLLLFSVLEKMQVSVFHIKSLSVLALIVRRFREVKKIQIWSQGTNNNNPFNIFQL